MTSGQRQTDEKILARREFADPYDAMSDDEFDAYLGLLFDAPSGPTRSITLRLPETLVASCGASQPNDTCRTSDS